jgi:hypothetical protein
LQENLDFGISAVAETGRLQISTEDGYGRITALASVELLLISVGNSDVNPPGSSMEPIVIREPGEKTLIQGGKLVVSGITNTGGTQPLLVELIASDGRIVGYRQASITGPAEGYDGGYFRFSAEVSYQVNSATWVRLTVKAYQDILPGPTHISSYEILLGP